MNDFNFIRNLRPPAAEPTTEVVQHEREHLMQFIQDTQIKRPRRRLATVGATVGISIVALGGVAAAAGLIPDAVTNRFTALEQRDGTIQIDSESATMVASDASGTSEAQLWVAPSEGGDNECEYVRSTWQSTNGGEVVENGPVACPELLRPWVSPDFTVEDPADYLASLDVFAIGSADDGFEATALTGAAHPDVAQLVVELADGQQLTVDVASPDGWFAAVIDGDLTQADALGLPTNPAVKVTLLGSDGRTLAELSDWERFQAQPLTEPLTD